MTRTRGELVRERRRQLGENQDVFARRTGISASVLKRLEAGSRDTVNITTCLRIADRLGISPFELNEGWRPEGTVEGTEQVPA